MLSVVAVYWKKIWDVIAGLGSDPKARHFALAVIVLAPNLRILPLPSMFVPVQFWNWRLQGRNFLSTNDQKEAGRQ